MIGSAMVYIGLVIAATGLTFVAKPIHALQVSTRSQGLAIVGLGLLLTGIGLTLPIAESRLENAETRVFANSPEARGRFARYWRVIYPGSAIIRRMWLRAVRRRAMNPAAR